MAGWGGKATIEWPQPGRSVPDRLDWLELRVRELKANYERERDARDEAIDGLRGDLVQERAARELGDAAAHAKIREFAGKDLWIAALGLAILLVGVPGSTIPAGTAHLIRSILSMHQPRCTPVTR